MNIVHQLFLLDHLEDSEAWSGICSFLGNGGTKALNFRFSESFVEAVVEIMRTTMRVR